MTAHQQARPDQSSGRASLIGGSGNQHSALDSWTGELIKLEAAARGVETRRAAVREYLTEPGSGCSIKASQLAARRVAVRDPELAHELAAAGARRQRDQAHSHCAERLAQDQAIGWQR